MRVEMTSPNPQEGGEEQGFLPESPEAQLIDDLQRMSAAYEAATGVRNDVMDRAAVALARRYAATPGEWRAEREVDLNGFETGKLWIVMGGAPCAYDFDRYEDAVLAAAAPALLEALRGLVPTNMGTPPASLPDEQILPVDMTVGELRMALAALLQATGGDNGR